MKRKIGKFVYWTPRILSIVFIAFLALMSLDVFSPELTFWQTIGALLMHNIPVFVLLAILLLSWKREIVGGIAFILAGLFYIAMLTVNAVNAGFKPYYIFWALQISGIAFFIGIMFLMGWHRKRK